MSDVTSEPEGVMHVDPQPEPRGSRYRENEPRSKLGFMAMIQARRGLVGFQRYIIENGSMPEGINIGILIRTAKGLAWRQVWDKDDITTP